MQGRKVTSSQHCNGSGRPEQKERQLTSHATFTALHSPHFVSLLVYKRLGWQCLRDTSLAYRRIWRHLFFSQTVVSLSQGTGADLQPDKNLEGLILVFPSPIQQSQPPEPVCPSADTGFFPGLPAIPDLHLRDNVVEWLQPGSFSGLGNLDHFHQNYDLSDLSLATQHPSSNPTCQPMWNHPPHPPSPPPQLSPLSSSPCSPLPGPSIVSSGQEHPPLPGQQPGQQNLPGGGLGSAEEPWRG